jgi:catechol 2,3-dioxygenase-like lactoylglutathione lyase family enzyme
MTRYNGINHLALVTGDMDRTIRFWRDLLEMPLVAGIGQPGYRHYFFAVSEFDLIAFFEWPGIEPLAEKDHGAPVRGRVGFDHVSLGVHSPEDLWQLKDRLEAAGCWTSEVVDHGFIHSLYAFDPNNIPIEFSYSLPHRDVRRSPVLPDRAPTATAREGAAPQPGKWPAVTRPTPPEARRVYPGAGSELFQGLDPQS